jgi:hypothetical protein
VTSGHLQHVRDRDRVTIHVMHGRPSMPDDLLVR